MYDTLAQYMRAAAASYSPSNSLPRGMFKYYAADGPHLIGTADAFKELKRISK